MSGPRFPNLSFDSQLELVMSAMRSNNVTTIPQVHTTFWKYERHLFLLCTLLDMDWPGPRDEALEMLQDDPSSGTVEEMFQIILAGYLNFALAEAESTPSATWPYYCSLVRSLEPTVQELLSMFSSSGRGTDAFAHWTALRAQTCFLELGSVAPLQTLADFAKVVALSRGCESASAASFLDLMQEVVAAEGVIQRDLDYFVAQYVRTVIGHNFALGVVPDSDLIEVLAQIACGTIEGFPAFSLQPQRVVVLEVYRMQKLSKLVPLLNPQALLNVLQLLEALRDADDLELYAKDLPAIREAMDSDLNMRHVNAFVKARATLHNAADQALVNYRDETFTDLLSGHIGAQSHFINWVSEAQGAEFLFEVSHNFAQS